MSLSVVVVDDFEPFRRYVCSALEDRDEIQVVGQAWNGVSALEVAERLRPDLVLLDIALPKMNGLEVAKHLRQLVPASKVLIVSQQFSFDMVEAALRAGALGYIHKLRVGIELLPGINAVRLGRYYVGGVFSERAHGPMARHEVQFVSNDLALQQSFADYITANLKKGTPVIVKTSEKQRSAIWNRLAGAGLDVDRALQTGMLVPIDAAEIISRLFCDGVPEATRFFDIASPLIETAARKGNPGRPPQIALCRHALPTLLDNGGAKAFRLEGLWNLMARRFGLDILCAYDVDGTERQAGILESLRAEHSAIHSGV